jgi:hypothetical protein
MGMSWKIQTLCLGLAFTLTATLSTPADQGDSAAPSAAIRFERSAWKAGDTITSEVVADGSMNVTMAVKGEVVQHFDQNSHELTHKKISVLKAGEDGLSKIAVHYDDVVEVQQATGDEDPDAQVTSPLAGKTFVLEQGSKGVTITDEDGTVVGEDIAAMVREKELARDGTLQRGVDRLALLVSESPRHVGEKIEVPEELALELAGGDEDLKDARMSLKLCEVREVDGSACAVFQSEIKLSGTAGGGEYKTSIDLHGEILIRVEGARFVSSELSGQVTVDGAVTTEETTVTITGEGPLKLVENAVYGRERS